MRGRVRAGKVLVRRPPWMRQASPDQVARRGRRGRSRVPSLRRAGWDGIRGRRRQRVSLGGQHGVRLGSGGRESGWIEAVRRPPHSVGTAAASASNSGSGDTRAGGTGLEVDADRPYRAHPSSLPLPELHIDLLADEVVARERPARAGFAFHQVERPRIADGQQPLDRLLAG